MGVYLRLFATGIRNVVHEFFSPTIIKECNTRLTDEQVRELQGILEKTRERENAGFRTA